MSKFISLTGLSEFLTKCKTLFYTKPNSGIPASDLASSVQTSLGKADSAYQKSNSGIPKTDLASSVQASLDLADSSVDVLDVFEGTIILVSGATNNLFINYLNGVASNSASNRATDFVDVSAYVGKEIKYLQNVYTVTTGTVGMAFYDSSKQFVSGVPCHFGGQSQGVEETSTIVPQNATFARFTIFTENAEQFYVKIDAYRSARLDRIDADIDEIGQQVGDRTAGAGQMGYKILRKGASFASQVTDINTIYEIRYDFNLGGGTATIPAGCVLKFNGGKISNGTIDFGNTIIDADNVVVFDGVTFANCTSNQKVNTIWFGITTNGQSNSAILENILDSFAYVFVNPGSYTMEGQITIANTARIKELTADKAQMAINAVALRFGNSNGFVIKKRIYMCGVSIYGNRGTYNAQDKVFENGFVGIDLYVSCVIEYCTISTWATGIETYNGNIISGVIRKCVFEKCGNYGLRFYSDSTIGSNNANLITDNYFINCGYGGLTAGTESTGKTSGIGMYVKGGSGNTIFHNVFEYCSGIGLFIDRPTTASIYRGLVVIGNYFEYCKWSNMYVDLNTGNTSLVYSIIIKGNSYSDSNLQLPADAQTNRFCNILDLHGMIFRRYIQTDFADRTLYQKYGGPLLFDMSMLANYNTGWEKIDWGNNCIRFIPGSSSESFTFVSGRAKMGYYALMVNCRNAGASNKVLSIQYKINGQSTITKSISLTTSMNTFARYTADRIFSNKEFEIQLYGAYSPSMQTGDRVEFNEIVLQEITSVSTTVRETLTPYAGFSIFDSTLNKMVLYNGSAWVNMDGTALS